MQIYRKIEVNFIELKWIETFGTLRTSIFFHYCTFGFRWIFFCLPYLPEVIITVFMKIVRFVVNEKNIPPRNEKIPT